MVEASLSDPWGARVLLTCQAQVGGETIEVRQMVAEPVYQDRVAREAVEKALREQLIREIVKKWTPVIKVRR